MPQWAGSSWYYLRYIDHNNEKLADEELLKVCFLLIFTSVVQNMPYSTSSTLASTIPMVSVAPTKEPFQKLLTKEWSLGTSYRDRGALVATDKGGKCDGSFFNIRWRTEQAPAKNV